MDNKNFTEVVLTGGPCAGKSSALAYLIERLSDRGVRALTCPEMATMLIGGGVFDIEALAAQQPHLYLQIQGRMMLMQRALRSHYQQLAVAFAPQPVVILYDRGEMDARAYLDLESWEALLSEHSLTLRDVRDSYDAVIHLVSAAKGAQKYYTTENNEARRESIEEAREADDRTLAAWTGHPHLWIVDNSTDFESKLSRVFEIVSHSVGIPAPVEIERKFLLKSPPDFSDVHLQKAQAIEIHQTYLQTDDPDAEIRVRKRSQDRQSTYYWTRKRTLEDGSREEREALIKPSEYLHLLSEKDPNRAPIKKTRYCFPYQTAYFELDKIERSTGEPLWILEVELTQLDQEVELPPCLEIDREVTGDKAFSNAALAEHV